MPDRQRPRDTSLFSGEARTSFGFQEPRPTDSSAARSRSCFTNSAKINRDANTLYEAVNLTISVIKSRIMEYSEISRNADVVDLAISRSAEMLTFSMSGGFSHFEITLRSTEMLTFSMKRWT
ncbi:phosphodiester glycosidase family protein [Sesbania bispinosa]|nr:phosphodiester glycosidase family protein [Sesbania bispinosa]